MKLFLKAVAVLIKKPFLIIYVSVIVLIAAVVNRLSPVFPLLKGFIETGDADFFQNIITFLQYLVKPDVWPYAILIIAGISAAASILAGVLLPGWMSVMNLSASGMNSGIKDYFAGLRENFLKTVIAALKYTFISFILALFVAIALVPLMIILRAPIFSRLEVLAVSVFIVALTLVILYMAAMFFRINTIFWLPALANGSGMPFMSGKRTADRHFWKLSLAMFIFDLAIIAVETGLSYFPDSIYVFSANWIFLSIAASVYYAYIFVAFKYYRESDAL
ncbi:MAG: hypothetical protein PHX37_05355 [Eubacteriales bacterium]|nr:hypothetical protein [Eubacteriales bacterium]